MRRQRAFTLVELLTLLALILVVIIAGCWISRPVATSSSPTVCANNLKVIGKAFSDYSHLNSGKFARVHTEGDPLAAPTADNDLKSISTNAMNQVWVLIAKGMLSEMAFTCPADKRHMARTSTLLYGWTNASEFSYGIQYPFDHDPAGKVANPACPALAAYPGSSILMADRNPGERVTGNYWPNHLDGCAYLTMAGSVFSHKNSNSVVSGQEIYGDDDAADGDIFPDSASDVVILPNPPVD